MASSAAEPGKQGPLWCSPGAHPSIVPSDGHPRAAVASAQITVTQTSARAGGSDMLAVSPDVPRGRRPNGRDP